MTIDGNEQGGIDFTRKTEADKGKSAARKASGGTQTAKSAKSTAPPKSQDIIARGGTPVKTDATKAKVTKPTKANKTTQDKTMSKTMSNTDINKAKDNVPDLQVFGDGDLFKLISKASSEAEGWMKSTKGMDVGKGVLIQVTTQQKNKDGSYAIAEALEFIPGLKISTSIDPDTNEVSRRLVGAR